MPVLQSVELFVLAGLLFLLLGAGVSVMMVRTVKTSLARWEPRSRHRALLLLAFLPLLTMLFLLLSASLPSAIALVIPSQDHCLLHADHAHLCFVHHPAAAPNLPLQLALVFVVSYAAVRIALFCGKALRATHVLSTLARTGLHHGDLNAVVIESAAPLCFAAGLWRPQILVSRGLLQLLDASERAIVLAHERAHVRRRDALIASVVRVCALWHFPEVARWLVREVEIAAEQVCDEEAATIVGDRISVAEAILCVERAARANKARNPVVPSLATVGFGERAVVRRVESLLQEPKPGMSIVPIYAGLCVSAATTICFANGLHRATEFVLAVIAR